jgi:hypothetical protein
MIARPLVWLGEDDPCSSHVEMMGQSETPRARAASLLAAGFDLYGSEPKLASGMATDVRKALANNEGLAEPDKVMRFALAMQNVLPKDTSKDAPTAAKLAKMIGDKLRHIRGAVHGGCRVTDAGKEHGATRWQFERVGQTASSAPPSPPAPRAAPTPVTQTGDEDPEALLNNV